MLALINKRQTIIPKFYPYTNCWRELLGGEGEGEGEGWGWGC